MNVDDLKSTIASALNVAVEQVGDNASGSTITEWDSIGHMNVVLALEERFNASFSVEEILAMRDVASIRAVLESKVSGTTHE